MGRGYCPTVSTKLTKLKNTMKLPDAPPASKEFKNAVGSDVPEEFALAARKDIDAIGKMVNFSHFESEKNQSS